MPILTVAVAGFVSLYVKTTVTVPLFFTYCGVAEMTVTVAFVESMMTEELEVQVLEFSALSKIDTVTVQTPSDRPLKTSVAEPSLFVPPVIGSGLVVVVEYNTAPVAVQRVTVVVCR